MTGTLLERIGRVIRHRRVAVHGWSQEQFADRCGMHRTYVAKVELGSANLSVEYFARIAKAFETPPSELLAEAETNSRRAIAGQENLRRGRKRRPAG